jgi:hypothetical protein
MKDSTHTAAKAARAHRRRLLGPLFATFSALTTGPFSTAGAGPLEQAMRLHDRLNGVPPTQSVLQAMQADIAANNPTAAALLAIDDPNGMFYSVVLKNYVMPWTNRAQTQFAPLNDYAATVIGMVRDNVPFNTVLSGDILYVGNSSLGLPAYSNTGNDHYAQMEARGLNLMTALTQTTQSAVTGLPSAATAGVITTRAAAQSFFVLGTNRAMFRFMMVNYMCADLPTVMDTTRPTDRIRQDVSRSPGGDSRVFFDSCVGCHSGMDPMVQAYAHYDFVYPANADASTGYLQYTPTQIAPKYFHNQGSFPTGYVTTSDTWSNRWRAGPNSLMGWSPSLPGGGTGAKSLGQEIAASNQFAQCAVTQVFQAVCLRPPSTAADYSQISTMSASLKQGYLLKQSFAQAGAYCMGK